MKAGHLISTDYAIVVVVELFTMFRAEVWIENKL